MSSSLSQRAYDRIQMMLLRKQILSGSKISEDSLAKDLGMSRTPVREAIRRLQMEGLVYQRPSSGTFVAEPDRAQLIEVYEVRMALEEFAIVKAAKRMRRKTLEELENYCRQMHAAVRKFRDSGKEIMEGTLLRDFLNADLAFHMVILKWAQNRYILKLIGEVHLRNAVFGYRSHRRDLHHVARTLLYHWRIAKALRAHKPRAAKTWLHRHIKESLHAALRSFDEKISQNASQKNETVDQSVENLMTRLNRSKPKKYKK